MIKYTNKNFDKTKEKESEKFMTSILEILEKHIGKLLSKGKDFVKDEWEKFKINTKDSFIEYLAKSKEKYSKIKTLLYRTEPKYIYDFFEYPTLKKNNTENIDSKDVDNLLKISNFLIVQGGGGIGKSTFMKHLFINELTKEDLIPIFIELKDINNLKEDYTISDLIFNRLYNFSDEFDKKYLDYALKSGCFLFLLDGYDEIVTEKQAVFFDKLIAYADKYSNNHFIISSRPYSAFVEFQRFTILSMCELSKNQAVSLIKKIDYDETIKNKFLKELKTSLYKTHTSFASNPLLLNIMLLTYDNYANIPGKLHLFYENAFDTLYQKHDATKGAYKRELRSKLPYDYFKQVFSYFCFISYNQGKIEFTKDELVEILKNIQKLGLQFDVDSFIYDLVNAICMLYMDGVNYRFTHRSFQEYFSATFLKELTDEKMQKIALDLIKKDLYRATHDNVFSMLLDMSQERFEQNILVPLLDEIEKYCTEDRYDFYFKKGDITMCFFNFDKKQVLAVRRRVHSANVVDFLQKLMYTYRAKNNLSNNDSIDGEMELLQYLIKYKNYNIDDEIKIADLDDEAYRLVKKTWIGKLITEISNLSIDLKGKVTKSKIDLYDILK